MTDQFAWLDRREYPFESKYFNFNNHRIHYIDEGVGEILLFVHGTPSWSFDFRKVILNLKKYFRCIAIDHIGFGLSDKPEKYDYSTKKHSEALEKFILDNNLKDINLVVHDFGGPIGFQVAINHPDLFKKFIVLNSWLWSSEEDPDFQKFSKILRSPLLPFLYLYFNFSPSFLLPRSFGDHKISKSILRQYTKPFANKSQRYGALAFARSLMNDQNWFDDLWHSRAVISSEPVLFLWGMKDPLLKPKYLIQFRSGFTNSKEIHLTNSGHFPQEEEPELVSLEIERFLKI
ncbi:MAG: alpha/beta fold hydrolase [Saprospiraceae bacterium]|nr:alpha/beta fold hydrolase [Saprospiraceae bacterium]